MVIVKVDPVRSSLVNVPDVALSAAARMARAARLIHEAWAAGVDVRTSDDVAMPVTFGSTILLPAEYADWSEAKRLAVLSHERAHVAHGDFYVLLLCNCLRPAAVRR